MTTSNWWSVLPNRLTPLYSEIHYKVRTIYGRDYSPLNTVLTPNEILGMLVCRSFLRTHVLSLVRR